jgi:hypothetical protein
MIKLNNILRCVLIGAVVSAISFISSQQVKIAKIELPENTFHSRTYYACSEEIKRCFEPLGFLLSGIESRFSEIGGPPAQLHIELQGNLVKTDDCTLYNKGERCGNLKCQRLKRKSEVTSNTKAPEYLELNANWSIQISQTKEFILANSSKRKSFIEALEETVKSVSQQVFQKNESVRDLWSLECLENKFNELKENTTNNLKELKEQFKNVNHILVDCDAQNIYLVISEDRLPRVFYMIHMTPELFKKFGGN